MAIVEIDDMKAHLGVTDALDDELISAKIEAAQAYVEGFLGYQIADRFTEAPADLQEAVRLQAAHFFENREATASGITLQVSPAGVEEIIRNRRSYAFE